MRQERRGKQQVRRHHTEQGDDTSFNFRRSRTITGSSASSVRSAGEERGQLRSPRLHEHTLRKHRRRLLVVLVICVAAIFSIWYAISNFVSSSVQVATLEPQPITKDLDTSRYSELANRYFSDHPFERFSFALDTEKFDEYIRSHVPEVSRATIEPGVNAFDKSLLAVQVRQPVASWTIKNQKYFVDDTGSAFTVNYFAEPTVVVNDKSGINAEAGVFASNKLLRFIGRVTTLVDASDIPPVESVVLPANSTRQVDFTLQGLKFPIKTNVDRDPAGQAADIINTVRYVSAKELRPAYLDVRVTSKAFYRDSRQ